jgi:hypothetical protein
MNKITIPLFDDYLKIFISKSTDSSVVMACLARNGFDEGCCASSLIKTKTGLSDQTIQRVFTRLIDQGIFIERKKIGKERYGKIVVNNDFLQKYSSLLVSSTNIHRNSFTCTVKKLNKEQSKIFLEGDDKRQYIAFCLNNHSTAFYLPIGIKIIFSGSLINCKNNITTVWMDDKTIECYEPTPTNNRESK